MVIFTGPCHLKSVAKRESLYVNMTQGGRPYLS